MAEAVEPIHPVRFRRSILAAALVAMATWWGIGLPYSLYAWLLDSQQLHWVLVCYAWEVPAAGILGPVLFPMLWFRGIERRWDRVFAPGREPDPGELAVLEADILDFPLRVGWVFVITSFIGYGVGAFQLRVFAQLPTVEVLKIFALGIVTGIVGGLFAFLYLEWLLGPLLQRIGRYRGDAAPAARRLPLFGKVFACSLILTLTALLLLGTIFYSRGERILEEEVGNRVLVEAGYLADALARGEGTPTSAAWWRAHTEAMHLGPSGFAAVVDGDGRVVAGQVGLARIQDAGFRDPVVRVLRSRSAGHLVDRVYRPRIVAFATVGGGPRRVVAVVDRREFAGALDSMLVRGGVVFGLAILLAVVQGFLFSRRLTRPIEVVTRIAGEIARAPRGPWQTLVVRTNDEVGALATAFNTMTDRLEEARGELERHSAELERRVAEATRNISTLYDVTRATTATLEIEDVAKLLGVKAMDAFDLRNVLVLWRGADEGGIEGYAVERGGAGARLEVGEIALDAVCPPPWAPAVRPLACVQPALPGEVAERLGGTSVLCLPLVVNEDLLGVVLGEWEADCGDTDLEMAAALASQAAAAVANALLFEQVRCHEAELRRLSQRRVQMQEEGLRTLSRELHDGLGQVLTAIKMDLSTLERRGDHDPAATRARLREIIGQVSELQQEVRSLSQLLRPSMLDDFGLVATLQWFTEKFSERTGLEVALRTPPAETRLPAPLEVLLYRVTQEAFTNVVKHAHAHHVEVDLAVNDGHAELTIVDDGVGFDPERLRRTPALGGVGLLGMRERVAHYQGRIEIRSRPRGGVRISLRIPIKPGKDGEGRMPLAG